MDERNRSAGITGAPYQGTQGTQKLITEAVENMAVRAVYENTAGVISRLHPSIDRELVALSFARQYASQNTAFKPKLFFRACGFDDATVAKLVGLGM
jgi:hypothetical protein